MKHLKFILVCIGMVCCNTTFSQTNGVGLLRDLSQHIEQQSSYAYRVTLRNGDTEKIKDVYTYGKVNGQMYLNHNGIEYVQQDSKMIKVDTKAKVIEVTAMDYSLFQSGLTLENIEPYLVGEITVKQANGSTELNYQIAGYKDVIFTIRYETATKRLKSFLISKVNPEPNPTPENPNVVEMLFEYESASLPVFDDYLQQDDNSFTPIKAYLTYEVIQ